MPRRFQDDFSQGGATTALTAHTPTILGPTVGYAHVTGSPTGSGSAQCTSATAQVKCNLESQGRQVYRISGGGQTRHHTIGIQIRNFHTGGAAQNDPLWFGAKFSNVSNFYATVIATSAGGASVGLWKNQLGVFTQLGGNVAVSSNSTAVAIFALSGVDKWVYYSGNGTASAKANGAIITSTDDSISANSSNFIGWGGVAATGTDWVRTAWAINSLWIDDWSTYPLTAVADAVLLHEGMAQTAGVDGKLMRTWTVDNATDAVMFHPGIEATAQIDGNLIRAGQAVTTGLDGVVQKTYTPTADLDAQTQRTRIGIVNLEGALQNTFTVTTDLDAFPLRGNIIGVPTDARLLREGLTVACGIEAESPGKQWEVVNTLDAELFPQLNYTKITRLDAMTRRDWTAIERQRTNWTPFGKTAEASTATAAVEYARSVLIEAVMSARRDENHVQLDAESLVIHGELGVALDCAIGTGAVQCHWDAALYGTAEPIITNLDSFLNREQQGLKQSNLDARLQHTLPRTAGLTGHIYRRHTVTTAIGADDIIRRRFLPVGTDARILRNDKALEMDMDAIKVASDPGGGGGGSTPGGLRINPNTAAPLTNNVQTINVPVGGGGWQNLPTGADIRVIMPNQTVTGCLRFRGNFRNLQIIGGRIEPTNTAGAVLEFDGFTGTVYIEGLHINAGVNGDQKDAIRGSGRNGDSGNFVIQNCYVNSVRGSQSGTHGDFFQGYGSGTNDTPGDIGSVDMDKVTVVSEFQGIFGPNNNAGMNVFGPYRISRCNFRYYNRNQTNTSYMLWTSDPSDASEVQTIYYTPGQFEPGVWVQMKNGQSLAEQGIWPKQSQIGGGCGSASTTSGQGSASYLWYGAQTGAGSTFTSVGRLSGRVYDGVPPTGDIVRSKASSGNVNDPGIGYQSPGYL